MKRKSYDYTSEVAFFSSPRTNIGELIYHLEGMDSVADLGCGRISQLRFLPRNVYTYGVDAFKKDIQCAQKLKTHNEFIMDDVMHIDSHFGKKSIDACVAYDLIEHLTKKDGLRLLKKVESISRKKVIIVTPRGFLPQLSEEDGDLQEHLSGWDIDEMKRLGYTVYGLDGLSWLRGERHRLKYRPTALWAGISWISQRLFCKHNPHFAATILCVKNLES